MMRWSRPNSSTWTADYSRYVVKKLRTERGITLLVYWYGFLAHRASYEKVGDELPTDLLVWIASHRTRQLLKVVEFEPWIAHRYGAEALFNQAIGPYTRRDLVKRLITQRGELNLPLKDGVSGTSWTLAQIFSDIYECIPPEAHESNDGV